VQRQLDARRVVQGCQLAAAQVLIEHADVDHLVPAQFPLFGLGIQLHQHRQLECAGHRKWLVAVEVHLDAALEVLDGDADRAARASGRAGDLRLQPLERRGPAGHECSRAGDKSEDREDQRDAWCSIQVTHSDSLSRIIDERVAATRAGPYRP